MKKIFLAIIMLSASLSGSFAQEGEFQYYKGKEIKTLLGKDRPGGGYGSFTMGYSEIDGRNAVLVGGRLSWIASHHVGIGFGGTGFINELYFEPSLNRDVFLTGGYGGLYIEPILFPRLPVHLAFPVLVGAGGISYISNEDGSNRNFVEDSEAFLLAEPAAEMELNLTRNFRLAFGITYRFPTPFNVGSEGSPAVKAESIKGFSGTVTLKIGKF